MDGNYVMVPEDEYMALHEAGDALRKCADASRRKGERIAELEADLQGSKLRAVEMLLAKDERIAELESLCRDMFAVMAVCDLDGARLNRHGKDADWRTMEGRMQALGLIGGES